VAVTAADIDWDAAAPPPTPRRARVGVVAGLVVGVCLGVTGWLAPSPGASLAVPALTVFGAGATLAMAAWVMASFVPQRRAVWGFSLTVGVCTLLATVWTVEFSLPTSMAMDGSATMEAQAALIRVEHGPKGPEGVPLHPCTTVTAGSVGPLPAPFRECAVSTFVGHFVTFTAVGAGVPHGIAYTDIGAATFQDECSRQLTSKWWMFTAEGSGTGECPWGYSYHGGG
jgi:hypothetical protein